MNRVRPAFALLLVSTGVAVIVACGETDYTEGKYDKRYAGAEALSGKTPPEQIDVAGATTGDGGGADAACATPVDAGPCSVSFKDTLLPLLITSCGSATCHGVPAGAKPLMDRASPTVTYANFLAQKQIDQKPYIDTCSTDKSKSAISCNLAATSCGIGMPYGSAGSLATSPLVTQIDTWLACGAPSN